MSNVLRTMNRSNAMEHKKMVAITEKERHEEPKITQAGLNTILYKLVFSLGGFVSVKTDAMNLPEGCKLHIHYNKETDSVEIRTIIPKQPKIAVPDRKIIT